MAFFLPGINGGADEGSEAPDDAMGRGGGDVRVTAVDVPFELIHGACKLATAVVTHSKASSTAFGKCIAAWVGKLEKEMQIQSVDVEVMRLKTLNKIK